MTPISLILAAALSLAVSGDAIASEKEWTAFFGSPKSATYVSLSKVVRHCNSGNPVATDRELALLEVLIEAKNRYAISIGFSILPCLDGGAYEDVARSLARLTDSHPELLLQMATENDLSDDSLTSLLVMLPETTIDDFEARQLWIEERIRQVGYVNDPKLGEIKQKALEILSAQRDEYSRDQPKP